MPAREPSELDLPVLIEPDVLDQPELGAPPGPTTQVASNLGSRGVEPDILGIGIVSGAGNWGTANSAHMIGQSGTAANQLPRHLKGGGVGVKP